ncbi:MAG: carboxypeptidase regulatory-like domain-containing protein [Candidatus Methylomirabilales bacterium]
MNPRPGVETLRAGLVMLLLASAAGAEIEGHPPSTVSRFGVVSGRVLYQGPLPREEWVPVHKHRELCGDERPLGQYRVSSKGEVENAVVILEGEAETLPLPGSEQAVAILDNRGCEFLPRVQVAQPRATLEVRNSDPILHSAHAYLQEGRTAFHVALPHFRDRTRTQLPQAGLLRIECDVGHTWMRAYILVSSSPFSAVTGGEGTFEIRGIPPGRYRLLAWHEAFGKIEREVSLGRAEQLTLTLVFGATRE